jgi:hypothetical protein
MEYDLKEIARLHELVSISVTLHADSGKYSANVQWMEYGARRCEFAESHTDTADEAVEGAITAKMKVGIDEADKARRIEALRAQLAILTGEQTNG